MNVKKISGRSVGVLGMSVALLAVWLLAPVSLAQDDDKLPSGEEIIKRTIDAQGGREAMEKVTSRVSRGKFEVPAQKLQGTVQAFEQAPDKQYKIIEIPGMGRIESGTNGDVHWEFSQMTGARILEGDEKAINERQSRFNAILHWKEYYKGAETVGVEDVKGSPAYKVKLTPKTGDPEYVFYDKETYLPVKMEMVFKSQMGEIPIEVFMNNYRDIDGVKIAHEISQSMVGMQQTITIQKIENNPKIPGEKFELPKPVQALVDRQKEKSDS